ncbi:MAG: L-2-hydroxyglutarate oxidase [Acidobacteria bacterium]|nr:L-2-hydroxyglutarate oxidase [Acidobacteriota bacterium]
MQEHHQFDLIIIGGGIIGLAVALEAGRRFPHWRLAVLEKEDRVAAHQTGHNSGVIHSGLYYKPGSLKARTCVEGAAAMVAFCQEHGIPHQICGKVVVATRAEEIPALEELHRRGTANGVANLAFLGPQQLCEIEPHSAGIRALQVPGTGITDYTAVAQKFAELVANQGGEIITGARVFGIVRHNQETVVETTSGRFQSQQIINCAGLHSDRVARLAGARLDLQIVPFRGEYYEIVPERQHLVKALIYPVPDPKFPFLGVHFTRRIQGGVEAGPNAVLAWRREGYRKTDFALADALETLSFPGFWRMAKKYWRSGLEEFYRSVSKKAFTRALQRLAPEIEEKDLRAGGAGVRAQALDRAGNLLDDFDIVRTENVIHVLNVPSPAATASLAIARHIVDRVAP